MNEDEVLILAKGEQNEPESVRLKQNGIFQDTAVR